MVQVGLAESYEQLGDAAKQLVNPGWRKFWLARSCSHFAGVCRTESRTDAFQYMYSSQTKRNRGISAAEKLCAELCRLSGL